MPTSIDKLWQPVNRAIKFVWERGDIGSETNLQMEEKDLIFRYVLTTEIGCSWSVASYDGGAVSRG